MRRKTLAVTMMMVTAMSWNAATQAGVISRTYNISATGAGVGFDDPLNVSVGVTFDPTVTTDSWPCAPVDSINFGGSNYAQYDKGGYAFTYDHPVWAAWKT